MRPEDIESHLMADKLQFCCCGDPPAVLELVFKFIKLQLKQRDEKAPAFQGKEWEEYCNRKREEKRKFVVDNVDAIIWFLYYVLDEKNIFTHGGNVSGAWLDDTEFFDLITRWNERQKHEN